MEKLKTWRKSLPEPTQAFAAELLGVTVAQVSRLETGERKVSPERAAEFERITGIPCHELRPDVFPAPRPQEAGQ
jgi:DNA-binding transcriptional regulator YdaS (Cro superfamily)